MNVVDYLLLGVALILACTLVTLAYADHLRRSVRK